VSEVLSKLVCPQNEWREIQKNCFPFGLKIRDKIFLLKFHFLDLRLVFFCYKSMTITLVFFFYIFAYINTRFFLLRSFQIAPKKNSLLVQLALTLRSKILSLVATWLLPFFATFRGEKSGSRHTFFLVFLGPDSRHTFFCIFRLCFGPDSRHTFFATFRGTRFAIQFFFLVFFLGTRFATHFFLYREILASAVTYSGRYKTFVVPLVPLFMSSILPVFHYVRQVISQK